MSTVDTHPKSTRYDSHSHVRGAIAGLQEVRDSTEMPDDQMKLLLVEDEDDFRDSCGRWMQRKGHEVSSAASGAEALSFCQSNDFDVAVFDMNMPGMSGMELLQRVVQDKIEMEVIILTGQGTIDMAVEAMKLGACDFLTKPCALGDLEHRCQLARNCGKLRRENSQLKGDSVSERSTVEPHRRFRSNAVD